MSSYAVITKARPDKITQGKSDSAIDNDKILEEIITRLQDSYYSKLITSEIYQELDEVFIETSKPNWDGYDALPVEKETLLNTKKFIKMLPLYITPPKISAEPDGSITLEWYRTSYWLFSLSIDVKGFLHYAAKFGARRNYGSEPFFDLIPQIILDLILAVEK